MPEPLDLTLTEQLTRPDITAAIQAHARAEWPREACGAVTEDGFVPLQNEASDPEQEFDCCRGLEPILAAGKCLALVHSHPTLPRQSRTAQDWPSGADMAQQIAMALPWGLLTCTADSASRPWFWGGDLPRPPLEGRVFRHGPSGTDGRGDCYAVIRDWFLATHGIELPEIPRSWEWWTHPELTPETNVYDAHFEQAGFRTIRSSQVRAGDCAMISIPSMQHSRRGPCITTRTTHAGVYVGQERVLHHLCGSRSVIELLGNWNRLIVRWVRHADLF